MVDAIETAIARVKEVYPFPGYMDDTEQAVRHIARTVTRFDHPYLARLLDIGCGGLDKLAVFQQLGYECYGTDDFLDPWHRRDGNLSRLLSFAADFGINVHVREDEGYPIPWPVGTFDVVTICDVIEHLHESPAYMLNEAGAYLRPGGLLVVTMPNSVNLRKRLDVLRGRTNYPSAVSFYEDAGPWRGHVREYTLQETATIVGRAGFSVVLRETFNSAVARRLPAGPLRWVFYAITKLCPTLRDGLCVAARKPETWAPRYPDDAAFRQAISGSVPSGVE